ncbi:MAG: hypothetical protein SF069_18050 [Phycisphaerae bacterium]|nr:hypothetical protein [Phycisphaerae bacterium]
MSRLAIPLTMLLAAFAIAQQAINPATECFDPRPEWAKFTPPWEPHAIKDEPMIGITPPTLAVGEETVAEMGDGAPVDGGRWVNDKPITLAARQSVEPALVVLPDGRMFVAVEDHGDHDGWISIQQSIDGGETWTWRISFRTGTESRNPAISFASRLDQEYLFLTYEASVSSDIKQVVLIRIDPRDLTWHPVTIEANIVATADIHPRICTDDALYEAYYVYVVYAVNAIDYHAIMFARSTDAGDTFSTPTNITGGSEVTAFVPQPDIAFGTGGLFVAFEKPGWSGSTWINQVWVTRSGNFGSAWSEPQQLTALTLGASRPAVAAAVGAPTVMVAYTRPYSTDSDIQFAYSADSGATWFMNRWLPWTAANEKSVALGVTHNGGRFHAAWWRDYDIVYTSAAITTPATWASTMIINEENLVSSTYARPSLCSDSTQTVAEEACLTWTDMREGAYRVYFDAGFRHIGDMNCDGFVTVGDIGGFVLALTNPTEYAATYPGCDIMNGDVDGNGFVTVGDIGAFVALLTS